MKSYIPITDGQRKQMLEEIGYSGIEGLFADIPEAARPKAGMDIPAMDERQLHAWFGRLAEKNKVGKGFLGGGAYNHYIPAAVGAVTSRSEFYTAYTPYQAEMSQGMLQAIFEYQSMICRLTGMDVSNASVYDGATAAAECMIMARNIKRKRHKLAVSEGLHPHTLAVLQTYARNNGTELVCIPLDGGKTDLAALKEHIGEAGGFMFQQPNFFGCLEDAFEIGEICAGADALCIAGCNPISLGLLAPPGEYADIAFGDGQPLGNSLSFGGPGLGFMAAKQKYMRNLPGRMVGESQDDEGNRGFLLTLQAREQHIRRDKAASNICSNQSLCAIAAAVYMATLGDEGLRQTAQACHNNAAYAHGLIAGLEGYAAAFDAPYFHEFVISCPKDAAEINAGLRQRGIIGGLDLAEYGLKGKMLLAFTEQVERADIDALVQALKEVAA